MRKVLLACVFVVLSLSSMASHIVGGEFELIHVSGTVFRLNMILYFDVNNGNPGARDNSVTASVFSKRNDRFIENIYLPFTSLKQVDYFQPECSNGEVVTDKIIYSSLVTLPESTYNEAEGYYIVWQRCCRNYTITNIDSNVPGTGMHAGQTFYLEFPPVVDENGNPFINSSPQLFPPLNDYGCPNRPYWVDFAGVDVDGDSLVYSIANPLSTQFSSALPPDNQNLSSPYPTVVWKPGFGQNNIMNGSPDLAISTDGFLTVTPRSQGLFAFAVKVEEFRNKKKIGEVRRDFQMLVVDKCPVASPPVVKGRKFSDVGFPYRETMNVTFNQSLTNEERCIQIEVSDLDASKVEDNYMEDVWIKAIPLNFKDDVSEILPFGVSKTLINGSTASFDICFPECPYREEGPFQVGIVAFDDACALPLSDTLRVTVNVEPPPNNKPYFQNGNVINLTVNEKKDGFWTTDIIGLDADADNLYLQVFPQGFDMDQYGMSFSTYSNVPGEIKTRFSWNYDCLQTSFDDLTDFEYILVLDDEDKCLFAHPDTLRMNLNIILPDNTFPDLFATDMGTRTDSYFYIEKELYQTLDFGVFAEDLDNDLIRIEAVGENFDMAQYGAVMPPVEGNGNPGLGTRFNWKLECARFNLAEQDSFRFYITAEDFDYCNITSSDTLTIDLKVYPPENNPPQISFSAGNEFVAVDGTQGTVTVGNPVIVQVLAEDWENNNINLQLIEAKGDHDVSAYSFTDVVGRGSVTSNLRWTPDCAALTGAVPAAKYLFTFVATDDNCIEALADTVDFELTVKDIEAGTDEFLPPNVFTPNGDGHNPFFAMEWVDGDGQTYSAGLPIDNCAGQFEAIRIYNRWGRQVYSSNERDFKWHGNGEPSGVYYYYIKYSNNEYKGTVTMLY
ncbi:MAG: gliding motility-associated C-terminal domain-containing protein [Cyclobacteriaceae bacterium]|nr:gliding motility-associated C-terminal domain-containing protein [Cyclobacteriaceae bacterium]